MTTNKEKTVWTQIFEIYKEMPHLWDKKNKNYMNKEMRNDSFRILLEIYKDLDKEATVEVLKNLISNKRTSFYRELKKVKTGTQTGSGTEDLYIPTLWYFDLLMFLEDTCEASRSSVDTLVDTIDESSRPDDASTRQEETQSQPKKKNRKSSLNTKQNELLDTANQLLNQKDDKWDIIGKSIAIQMKDIDDDQLTVVNKIISDAIFYAKHKKLSMNSHIVLGTEDLTKTSHSPLLQRSFTQRFPRYSPQYTYLSSPQSETMSDLESPPLYTVLSPPPPTQTHQPLPQMLSTPSHAQSRQSVPQASPSPDYTVLSPPPNTQSHQPLPQTSPSPQYIVLSTPSHIQSHQPLPQMSPSPQYTVLAHSPHTQLRHHSEPQTQTESSDLNCSLPSADFPNVSFSNDQTVICKGNGTDMKDFIIFNRKK
ncbi:uncharacterized protein LOC124543255 [Vanessa cardui]|uniref:uncharacterized protein LOC124543255 n=1 Tax=Vanessa cardui TaxID=171605 RepID=UPI001F13DADB|nr:uncharacterized protein LOC124543255 [Vanessa cardui]